MARLINNDDVSHIFQDFGPALMGRTMKWVGTIALTVATL